MPFQKGNKLSKGRPKAKHTVEAEKAKETLVKMFVAEKKRIFTALLDRAIVGEVPAIRELFERVWGKESQPFSGNLNHTFDDITEDQYRAILERESRRVKVSGE